MIIRLNWKSLEENVQVWIQLQIRIGQTVSDWSPDTWQEKPALQLPEYSSENNPDKALQDLNQRQPIVNPTEIHYLQTLLADAAAGRRFLLQAGDCAEPFHECTSEIVNKKCVHLLELGQLLQQGLSIPIVHLGRKHFLSS